MVCPYHQGCSWNTANSGLELDKSRSNNKKSGGSLFSSNTDSFPRELDLLAAPQQTVSKLVLSTKTSLNAANQDYDKLTDPSAPLPSAPVHAARLNGLLKTLANAEGAVAESIKARKTLIEGLEKMLDMNRIALATEETQLETLTARRNEIDAKKKDVEDSIMRGFASSSNPGTPAGVGGSPAVSQASVTPAPEPDRPEVEALTPPSYDQPSNDISVPELDLHASNGAHTFIVPVQSASIPQPQAPSDWDALTGFSAARAQGLSRPSAGSAKKRKLSSDHEFLDFGEDAMDGLDADVAEMLRQDAGN